MSKTFEQGKQEISILERILNELEKMNVHLSILTNEEVKEYEDES